MDKPAPDPLAEAASGSSSVQQPNPHPPLMRSGDPLNFDKPARGCWVLLNARWWRFDAVIGNTSCFSHDISEITHAPAVLNNSQAAHNTHVLLLLLEELMRLKDWGFSLPRSPNRANLGLKNTLSFRAEKKKMSLQPKEDPQLVKRRQTSQLNIPPVSSGAHDVAYMLSDAHTHSEESEHSSCKVSSYKERPYPPMAYTIPSRTAVAKQLRDLLMGATGCHSFSLGWYFSTDCSVANRPALPPMASSTLGAQRGRVQSTVWKERRRIPTYRLLAEHVEVIAGHNFIQLGVCELQELFSHTHLLKVLTDKLGGSQTELVGGEHGSEVRADGSQHHLVSVDLTLTHTQNHITQLAILTETLEALQQLLRVRTRRGPTMMLSGLIPVELHQQLLDQQNFQSRTSAVEKLKKILESQDLLGLPGAVVLEFISFLHNLLEDCNFKVQHGALQLIYLLVQKLEDQVEKYYKGIVHLTVIALGDPRSPTRQQYMRIFHQLMQELGPQRILELVFAQTKHRNSRVREDTLNIIIAALLTHPRQDFDIPYLCNVVAPCLLDSKRRVRHAALEAFAVLDSCLDTGMKQPLMKAVNHAELMMEPGCPKGLMEAVNARRRRHKLPLITSDGSVEYALTLPKPGQRRLSPQQSGADLDWVLNAAHRNSALPQGIVNGDVDVDDAPQRRIVSAGKGKKKLPWERNSLSANGNTSEKFRSPGRTRRSLARQRRSGSLDSDPELFKITYQPDSDRGFSKSSGFSCGAVDRTISLPSSSMPLGSILLPSFPLSGSLLTPAVPRRKNADANLLSMSNTWPNKHETNTYQTMGSGELKSSKFSPLPPRASSDNQSRNMLSRNGSGNSSRPSSEQLRNHSARENEELILDRQEMLNSLRPLRNSAAKKRAKASASSSDLDPDPDSPDSAVKLDLVPDSPERSPSVSSPLSESGLSSLCSPPSPSNKHCSPVNSAVKHHEASRKRLSSAAADIHSAAVWLQQDESPTEECVRVIGQRLSYHKQAHPDELKEIHLTWSAPHQTQRAGLEPRTVRNATGSHHVVSKSYSVKEMSEGVIGKGVFGSTVLPSRPSVPMSPSDQTDSGSKISHEPPVGVYGHSFSSAYMDSDGSPEPEETLDSQKKVKLSKFLREKIRPQHQDLEGVQMDSRRCKKALHNGVKDPSLNDCELFSDESPTSANGPIKCLSPAHNPTPPVEPANGSAGSRVRRASSLNRSRRAQSHNSDELISVSPKEEVQAELRPFSKPELALIQSFSLMASDDWEKKIEGMLSIRSLAQFHPDVLMSKVHEVCLALIQEVRNLRSGVSRGAVVTLGEMFSSLQKGMDQELDSVVRVLLQKAGELNAFIRQDMERALNSMIMHCTHTRSLSALLNAGLSHRNVGVRRCMAQHLSLLVEQLGAPRILSGAKDLSDRVLPAVCKLAQDSNQEARYFGRRMLLYLSSHRDFDKMVEKFVPEKEKQAVRDTVFTLQTKGLGEMPQDTPSARGRRSLVGSGLVRTSSLRSGVCLGKAHSLSDRSEYIKQMMALLGSKDFRDRIQAIDQLVCDCEENPALIIDSLVPVCDALTARLQESNTKVNMRALESLPLIFSSLGERLSPVLNLLIPALVDTHLNSRNPAKQELIDTITELVLDVYPSRPQLVEQKALPLLWSLISASTNQSTAGTRESTCRLAQTLHSLLGDTLMEQAVNQGVSVQTKDDDDDDDDLLLLAVHEAECSLTSPGFDPSAGQVWIYPSNYPVRGYQLSICKAALFTNTLVCLPTGLGKTFIAAVLMYNYYRWFPAGKIIFTAPTRPLVAQQIQACFGVMGIPQEHMVELTGSTSAQRRASLWSSRRVFFLTPQVMLNDLCRLTCPATQVKCVVIDEAHRATGNHAYVQVIRELHSQTQQFRILALSATPGGDIKAVQQVISNLLISHIELRSEEDADIQQHVHQRSLEKIVVPLGEVLTGYQTKYLQVLERFTSRLTQMRLLNHQSPRVRNELQRCPIFMELYRDMESMFSSSNSTGHPKDAFAYSHPKLQKLDEVVLHHFETWSEKSGTEAGSSAGNTRVMIFSSFRESVQEITEMLKRHQPLLRVMSFMGQAAGGRGGRGFTQKEQLRVVRRFREGGFNTLVSTCVGEEGLDIGEVDLIVCFDAQKSPVRLVQRMGRTGRRRQGRIVIILAEGREERTYNQSQSNRRSITRSISGRQQNFRMFGESPRMIPTGVSPSLHMMNIRCGQFEVREPEGRTRKVKGQRSELRLNETDQPSLKQDGFLSPTEAAIWSSRMRLSEDEAQPLLTRSTLLSFPDQQTQEEDCVSGSIRPLSLWEWRHWQNRPLHTHAVTHSDRCLHFTAIMDLIDTMREEEGDCDYESELMKHLQQEDVNEDKTTNIHKTRQKRTTIRHKKIKANKILGIENTLEDQYVETKHESPLGEDPASLMDFMYGDVHQAQVSDPKMASSSTQECEQCLLEDQESPEFSHLFYQPKRTLKCCHYSLNTRAFQKVLANVEELLSRSPPKRFNFNLLDEMRSPSKKFKSVFIDDDESPPKFSNLAKSKTSIMSVQRFNLNSIENEPTSPLNCAKIDLTKTKTDAQRDPPDVFQVTFSMTSAPQKSVESEGNALSPSWDELFEEDLDDGDVLKNDSVREEYLNKSIDLFGDEEFLQISVPDVPTPEKSTGPEGTKEMIRTVSERTQDSSTQVAIVPERWDVTPGRMRGNRRSLITGPEGKHTSTPVHVTGNKLIINEFQGKQETPGHVTQSKSFLKESEENQETSGNKVERLSQTGPLGDQVMLNGAQRKQIPTPGYLTGLSRLMHTEPEGKQTRMGHDVTGSPSILSGLNGNQLSTTGHVTGCRTVLTEPEGKRLIGSRLGLEAGQVTPGSFSRSSSGSGSDMFFSVNFDLGFESEEEGDVNPVLTRAKPSKDLCNSTPKNNSLCQSQRTETRQNHPLSDQTVRTTLSVKRERTQMLDHSVPRPSWASHSCADHDSEMETHLNSPAQEDSVFALEEPSICSDAESPVQARRRQIAALNTSEDSDEASDDFQHSSRQNHPHIHRKPPLKKPQDKKQQHHSARQFLDEEAELSEDEDVSSDEVDDDEEQNQSMLGFVVNNTTCSQGLNDSEMQAVYLRSVRSPALHNRLRFTNKHTHSINVFSQVPEQDETYQEDSFLCDGSEEAYEEVEDEEPEVILEDSYIDGRKQYATRRRAKIRLIREERESEKQTKSKKSRIIRPQDSSEDEEKQCENNQSRVLGVSVEERARKGTVSIELPRENVPQRIQNTSRRSNPDLFPDPMEIKRQRFSDQASLSEELDFHLEKKAPSSSVAHAPLLSTEGQVSMLVDPRCISGSSELVSRLRHIGVKLRVCSLSGPDFILSKRMAVNRESESDLSGVQNRRRLQERIQKLQEEHERVCLIIQRDRTKPGEPVRIIQHSRHYAATLALLAKAGVRLLFSNGIEDTAAILNELVQLEKRKGQAIDVPLEVRGHQQRALQFCLSLPRISYVTALIMSHRFNSVVEIINSSVEDLQSLTSISHSRAEEIYRCLRYSCDPVLTRQQPVL
ncbi:hypothetical protein DNTS_016277 [Danionella cerebrum]|uniref:Uncharacterized protein n=1 Tax=Danionella cerebrum TaxID=2873325 RepID=A0A553Q0W2_9TELE|nr:hypothetical protein DNTS_016277 [Danionella translucida]